MSDKILMELSDEELTQLRNEAQHVLDDVSEELERRTALPIVEQEPPALMMVLDIETTGFLNQGGCIVEIGCVELNLKNGKIKRLFGSVCREPQMTAKDRNAWIFLNSSLTVEEVRNAPLLEVMKPALQELFDYYPVTAFNRDFDIPFLQSRGFVFKQLAPCPMLVAMDVLKIPGTYGEFKWPRVEEAFRFLFPGVAYAEAHRGASDASDEAQIVYELFKRGYYKL